MDEKSELYYNLEFWLDRYKSLFSIFKDVEKKGGIWNAREGQKISLRVISEAFPLDFRAYLNVFGLGGQIGQSGMGVLGVDYPEPHDRSQVYQTYYSWEADNNEMFERSGVRISEILWFGYTANAADVWGFHKDRNEFRVVSTYFGNSIS